MCFGGLCAAAKPSCRYTQGASSADCLDVPCRNRALKGRATQWPGLRSCSWQYGPLIEKHSWWEYGEVSFCASPRGCQQVRSPQCPAEAPRGCWRWQPRRWAGLRCPSAAPCPAHHARCRSCASASSARSARRAGAPALPQGPCGRPPQSCSPGKPTSRHQEETFNLSCSVCSVDGAHVPVQLCLLALKISHTLLMAPPLQ